jgi:hypothetical protein
MSDIINMKEIEAKWNDISRDKLAGKTINVVRYMTDKEMEDFMWYEKGLVIFFTDGTYMIPMKDDEGNGAGALYFNDGDVLPVIQ